MAIERVRVYDLARDMGLPNKDLMTLLKDKLNLSVKSHSSTISVEDAETIRNLIKKDSKPKETSSLVIKEEITPKKTEEKLEPVIVKTEEPKELTKPEVIPKPIEKLPPKPEQQIITQKPQERPLASDNRQIQQQRTKPTTLQQKPVTADRPYHVSGDKYKYKPENKARQDIKPERFPSKKPSYGHKFQSQSMPAAATTPQEQVVTATETQVSIQKQPIQEIKDLQIEVEPKTQETKPPEATTQEAGPQEPRLHDPRTQEHRVHETRIKESRTYGPKTPETKVHEPRPHELRPHEPRTQEHRPHQYSPQQRPSPNGVHQRPSKPFGGVRSDFRQQRPDAKPIDRSKLKPAGQKEATNSSESPPGQKYAKPTHKKEQLRKKEYFQKEKFQDLKPLTEIFKKKKPEKIEIPIEKPTEVTFERALSIAELGVLLVTSPTEIIKELMNIGIFATLNETISVEVAKNISEKLGYTVNIQKEQMVKPKDELLTKDKQPLDKTNSVARAPIVTIMGHVDHGKTTLLDSIRKTKHKIVDSEVGGITQSIGAYSVGTGDKRVVFIDTPGHQAFTAMRARGAQATDIAVLIVAADDGIMPQTVEAINHAKSANVPIIIAINKIDKAGVDPDRILQQLTEHGLLPEAWGGDTVTVQISALKGDKIDDLLEMISLVSEIQELKADPTAIAAGVVIESRLDKGKGPVATVLVQNGTLHVGDYISIGSVGGKIRALIDDLGERVSDAGPSTPVEVLGLNEVPTAGATFTVVNDDKTLKQIISKRKEEDKEKRLSTITPIQLQKDTIFKAKQKKDKAEIKELNIIIKADTNGSAKAVETALQELKSKEITVKIIHTGVGDISEADVMLAVTSNSMIIGFRVKEDANAEKVSALEGVNIRTYEIIYQISEDIEKTLLGLIKPEFKEVELGTAEVRNLFTVGKNLVIAGCYVLEGKIVRNRTATVLRDNKEIFKGNIDNLKRFKDDAKEVNSGYECGISFNKFNDLKEGDIIKVTTLEEIERENLN